MSDRAVDDQTTSATFADGDDALSDYPVGARIEIDYAAIIASTEPDQPGGRIVYDSDDYETDEEADAALEAFFMRIIEAPIKKRNRPRLRFTAQAKRDIESCRLFLYRRSNSQPERRIREIYKAARVLPDSPKLDESRPASAARTRPLRPGATPGVFPRTSCSA